MSDPTPLAPPEPLPTDEPAARPPSGAGLANFLRWVTVALLTVTAGLSWWHSTTPTTAHDHPEGPFTCPMHPTYVADKPGSCPICGMDLVSSATLRQPATDDPGDFVLADLPGVQPFVIATDRLHKAGVAWHKVQRQTLQQEQMTLGLVRRDPSQSVVIEARTAGWLEYVAPLREGDVVRKGDLLVRLLSREVQIAQAELAAAKVVDQMQDHQLPGPSLQSAARTRLRTLGSSAKQGGGHSEVRAPRSGTVLSWGGQKGSFVSPGQALGTLGDPAAVQVELEVPADWSLERGTEVTVTWRGVQRIAVVDQLLPASNSGIGWLARLTLQPAAKTAASANESGVEWPDGAAVQVTLTTTHRDVVVIPRTAVVQEGETTWVYRRAESGRLWPTRVVLGLRTNQWVEVLSGLPPEAEVITKGTFLVDTESRLAPAFAADLPAAASPVQPKVPAVEAGLAADSPGQAADKLSAEAIAALVAATEALAADNDTAAAQALGQLHTALPNGLPFAANPTAARKSWHKWLLSMWPALQRTPQARDLYVAWCPMAPGRWLQRTKTLANPYFGAKMLRCGEILGTVATVAAQPTPQEAP